MVVGLESSSYERLWAGYGMLLSVVVEPPLERTVSWRSQHDGMKGVELEYSRQPLAVQGMSLRGRAGIQPLLCDLIGLHSRSQIPTCDVCSSRLLRE